MEHIEQQSPFGSPNSLVASIHNGARLWHLARPEVLVQVHGRRPSWKRSGTRRLFSQRTLFVDPIINDVQGLCAHTDAKPT